MATVSYNAAVGHWFRRAVRLPAEGCVGRAGSTAAGCAITVGAAVEGDLLAQVGFRVHACPHIIAACNLLAARLVGRPVADLAGADLRGELNELEIPVEKAGKILILEDALSACHAAIRRGQRAD